MSDKDREAFEEWAKESMNAGATNGMLRHENGEYMWGGTALAWRVWQAALAHSAAALAAKDAEHQAALRVEQAESNKWRDRAAANFAEIAKWYELAWDIPTKDMIDVYAIFQKWSDQSISADLYRKVIGDATVSSSTMLDEYFYMTKMGIKSRYYQVSKTSEGLDAGCGSGGCSI